MQEFSSFGGKKKNGLKSQLCYLCRRIFSCLVPENITGNSEVGQRGYPQMRLRKTVRFFIDNNPIFHCTNKRNEKWGCGVAVNFRYPVNNNMLLRFTITSFFGRVRRANGLVTNFKLCTVHLLDVADFTYL